MDPYDWKEEYIKLSKALIAIRVAQGQATVANQGQAMDGFSALANYNGLAEEELKKMEATTNEQT